MSAARLILPAMRGADYSYARPGIARLKAEGFTFVCRYITNNANHEKALSVAERDELHAADIGIILVWESGATRPLGGGSAGVADGETARARAYALGYPGEFPIVAAVDIQVLATDYYEGPVWDRKLVMKANLNQCESYVRGFHRGCAPYPMGVYGGTVIIDRVADICALGWQANARSWSPHVSPNVHVKQGVQSADHVLDPNVAVKSFKTWGNEVAVAPPIPPPAVPALRDTLAAVTTGESMYFVANSDKPGDPTRYLCNGFAIRYIGEKDANELVFLRLVVNDLAHPIYKTTAEIDAYVRVPVAA